MAEATFCNSFRINMLHRISLTLVVLTVAAIGHSAYAQDDTSFAASVAAPYARHSVYTEVLGSGLLYSFNYEYRVTERWGLRAGVSLLPVDTRPSFDPQTYQELVDSFEAESDLDPALIIPLHVNRLIGSGRHRLEVGAGLTLLFAPENRTIEADLIGGAAIVSGVVSYRYQREQGFQFRAGLMPSVTASSIGVLPGLSLGYAF